MAQGDNFLYQAFGSDGTVPVPCIVQQINGFNTGPDLVYVGFEDDDSGVVVDMLAVPAGAQFTWAPPDGSGDRFAALIWYLSSTPDVFTPVAVDAFIRIYGRETV